jgi:hypothetical protein
MSIKTHLDQPSSLARLSGLTRLFCLLSFTLGLSITAQSTYRAHAFGLFISTDPISTSSTARLLVARTERGLRYLIQGKAATESEGKTFWVIPVPNVANTEENPPLINAIDPAPLMEVADLTMPRFEGACADEPNGQVADARQEFSEEAIPYSYAYVFNAQKLSPPPMEPEGDSELHRFFANEGITVSEELDELMRWSLDQNLMLLVIEYEERRLSAGASPAIDVSLTLPENTAMRVALKQLTNTVMGTSTDFVFYVMGDERARANFPTRELDTSVVSFTSPDTTDYMMQFDVVALAQQSQVFITEFVGNLTPSTFADELLATWRNELASSKLTRLRARFIAAALRNNAESITLRGEAGNNYSRAHRVPGFMCAEEAGEMAGEEAGEEAGEMAGEVAGETSGEMAGEEAGEEAGEMAGEEAGEGAGEMAGEMEAGEESEAGEVGEMESMGSGSSSDDGCQSASRAPNTLSWLLVLIALFITSRRVRRGA